jgi:hypothetical protein
MYLVHYVFAVWLQYALNAVLLAFAKAAIVFGRQRPCGASRCGL